MIVETQALIAAQLKKYPGLTIFKFSSEDYSSERLEEAFLGQTLFDEKFAVVLDGLGVVAEKILTKYLSILGQSPNLYLLAESEVAPEFIKQIRDVGGRVKEVKGRPAGRAYRQAGARERQQAGFNPFAVTDALGERDRKRAWVLFQAALARGLAPEEIFWKLVWKVKTLLLVETAPPGSTLPLKPYPLSEARRQVKGYKPGELAGLSSRLVRLYHDSRRGRADFALGLERLVLEI